MLVNRLRCHLFAFVCALLTGIGALLAMLGIVLAAFLGTCAARLGAHAADFVSELRTGTHEQRRGAAEHRAVAVQLDAAHHAFHVILLQTFAGAVGAFVGTMVTSFNAFDVFFVWHKQSPSPATYTRTLSPLPEFRTASVAARCRSSRQQSEGTLTFSARLRFS
jgi:hypothetical protein